MVIHFGHNHDIQMTSVKHGYQIEIQIVNQKTYFPNRESHHSESGFIVINQDSDRDSSSKQVHTTRC